MKKHDRVIVLSAIKIKVNEKCLNEKIYSNDILTWSKNITLPGNVL